MGIKRAVVLAVLFALTSSHKVANDDEPAAIVESTDGVKIIDEGETKSTGPADEDGKKKARKPTKRIKWDFTYFMTNYFMEMCILSLFGLAFVVLIYGKNENKRVVERWHVKALEELNEQFAHLGQTA